MTPQEAKYRIEHDTDDERFDGDLHGIAVDLDEALKIACEALEKQIPKKPIKETEDTGFKDRFICVEVDCKEVNYRCPVCGEPLGTNYNDDYYNEWLNVCNNCFQRIDWESDNQ